MVKGSESKYGVIFDMDGVLIDSEIHWKAVGSSFLKQILPQWSDELQRSIFGLSIYRVYEVLVEQHELKLSREQFLDRYKELAQEIYCEKTNLIPGSLDCLTLLKNAGVPLALASSAPRPWIELVVTRFELSDFFAALASSDDVGANPKPAPDIYQHVIAALGLPADRCVAIEDHPKGVSSAKKAGARCIALRNGFNDRQDFSEADLVLGSFSEFSLMTLEGVFGQQ